MSQREYRSVLKKELQKLNKKIDEKILWGLNYKDEAKRHKALILKMQNMRRRSFFGRAFQFMSLF